VLFFLDLTLFAIHIAVIVFNLFGWVKPSWRKAHFLVVCLTLFSWLILGLWFGFGYCFLTDIEWDIKRDLGEKNLPGSFVAYLTNNVFGMELSRGVVDGLTLGLFVPAVILSFWFRFRKNKT